MSAPGLAYLGSIRLQAQQRADMVNSNFVSIPEWNSYATNSYKELYDLLISAYGNDYFVSTPYAFSTDGINYLFALPTDFYKILGLDLMYTSSPGSFITIKRFNFNDRNRYSIPNFQSFYGVTNIRYRITSNNIWLTPIPASGQNFQMWYAPQPTNLQAYFIGSAGSASTSITVADTSQLAVGMTISAASGITSGTTISAITANTSITISVATTAAFTNQTIAAWNDSTVIQGISGWEEYIITDMAIKALQKEESDVSVLAAQKLDLRTRLNDMSANRDQGFPQTVNDTQWMDDNWSNSNGNGDGVW